MTGSNQSITVSSWLKSAIARLKEAEIETPRLDALVLLADYLAADKSTLLAYPERILQRSDYIKLDKKIAQRADHTPLAYLRGKAEFYGQEFIVSPSVLVPRPESEAIIDSLLSITTEDYEGVIIDVGTGSGCLAIIAKQLRPNSTVYGLDIDPDCLDIARNNSSRLNSEVSFSVSNLLTTMPDGIQLEGTTNILLANLPYVPEEHPVNKAVIHEPSKAVYGGKDGLNYFRRLFSQLKNLRNIEFVITESLTTQHAALNSLAADNGFSAHGTTNGLVVCFKRMDA